MPGFNNEDQCNPKKDDIEDEQDENKAVKVYELWSLEEIEVWFLFLITQKARVFSHAGFPSGCVEPSYIYD